MKQGWRRRGDAEIDRASVYSIHPPSEPNAPCFTPYSSFLAGIAVADMLVMIEYIPYIVHMNLWKGRLKADQYR